jgi:type IX secretion system PorP/SprF family membrane protein
MKKFISFFILLSCTAFSQDAYFSSSQLSLVYSNPSFAGRSGAIRNQALYTSQKGFSTAINTIDGYIKPLRAGVAITAFSDDMNNGTLRNSYVSISYAQYFVVKGQGRLIPSFQVSMATLTLDKSKLNFGDIINPRNGERWDNALILPAQQKNYMNMSAGLLYSAHGLYTGISLNNINQPDVGLVHRVKMPVRTSIYISDNVSNGLHFTHISFLANFQPGTFNMMLKWTHAVYKYFLLGAGYTGIGKGTNYDQGVVANCGFRYKFFTLMYGYDQFYVINSDYSPLRASHEISLSISIRNPKPGRFGGYMETW